ncbi:hypothetical protein G4D82_07925 [Flavobacterium sp. CYK-4]|uniref:LIC_10190 family membrane protein n=1 Tax=Flavobacterium lotistagni TaxID=2709660 RepID=UPI00140A5A70|nr:hypothetical protein [Flavobacterium lotistagni]NHM07146.1 hypothetical protein [Flavobacterium lotistagni]
MLLLLLYWSFLGIALLNVGFGFQKMVRLKIQMPLLTMVLGMFAVTVLASIWAIFYRINFEFQLFLLALQGLIVVRYKSELAVAYANLGRQLSSLSKQLKAFLLLTILLLLLYVQSNEGFVDNETYYVQTIKWLNEYGLVKGLANLHIFFGQTCGWHILQSAFSFSFVSNHFNQLNGFCFLLGNVFAVFQLDEYFKNNRSTLLWIGLLPIANVLLFAYCAVPSAGLALVVISLILFGIFVKNFNTYDSGTLLISWLLAVFLVYLKISILPIVLVPIVYTVKHFKNSIQNLALPLVLGIAVLGLFITKNYILTGYPLYPSVLFKNWFQTDYTLPETVYNFWFNRAKCYDFFISSEAYAQLGSIGIFVKWLLYAADSLMHAGIVVLVLILPFFIMRYCNQKAYWMLYMVLGLQLGYMAVTSPQFRFIIPFALFFTLLLLSIVVQSKNLIYKVLWSTWILAFLLWFSPIQMRTRHEKLVGFSEGFSIQKLALPNENSSLKTNYSLQEWGNLRYFSPDATVFIWANGDGALPCVNKKQLQYLNEKLHYVPQLRTGELKDGFYSQKTN